MTNLNDHISKSPSGDTGAKLSSSAGSQELRGEFNKSVIPPTSPSVQSTTGLSESTGYHKSNIRGEKYRLGDASNPAVAPSVGSSSNYVNELSGSYRPSSQDALPRFHSEDNCGPASNWSNHREPPRSMNGDDDARKSRASLGNAVDQPEIRRPEPVPLANHDLRNGVEDSSHFRISRSNLIEGPERIFDASKKKSEDVSSRSFGEGDDAASRASSGVKEDNRMSIPVADTAAGGIFKVESNGESGFKSSDF